MKCQDIIEIVEKYFPREYACSWDNVGLLAGRREKEVKKVYIALDATKEVIEEAISFGADVLFTHHPLIFGKISSVTTDTYEGERLVSLIQNDISYYAMHTNYDVCGMAKLSADLLGLEDTKVLEEVYLGEGIGRVGTLPQEMTLEACGQLVKEVFHLPNVKIFGDLKKTVKRVALSPGAGKSMAKIALEEKVDVLITGDIDHHTGIDMAEQGVMIMDAGHYGIEHIYIKDLKELLERECNTLEIKTHGIQQPFQVL